MQTVAYSFPAVITQLCALIPAVIQGMLGFNPNNYEIKKGESNVLSEELVAIADRYADIAIWISVASGALMLICLSFYSLDKKKHAEIIAELKANSVNSDEIENSASGCDLSVDDR